MDAAIIARKLAEGRSSDLNKWAPDYNGDGKVTALDCAEIARFLAKLSIIEHTTAPNENKTETTKDNQQESQAVKTGDQAPITMMSVLGMISLFMFVVLQKKYEA